MDSSPVALILCVLLISVAAQTPVVSVEPRAVTVSDWQSVSFRCQVHRGAQPIKLKWRRDNKQALPVNAEIGPGYSVLTFTNPRPEYKGEYHCIATNSAGLSVATAVLNVRYTPVVQLIPQGPLQVKKGKPVSVECRATGNPEPTLMWKRIVGSEQVVLPHMDNVKTLQWAAADLKDSGYYLCLAVNSEGVTQNGIQINVIVEDSPRAQMIPEGPLRVKKGDPVSVECRATGNPEPSLVWKRAVGNDQVVLEHMNNVKTLKWAAVHPEDSGYYMCLAKNSVGVTQVGISIIVEGERGAPVASVNPTKIKAIEGQTLTIQCQASASPPPVITWSKLQTPLVQNVDSYITINHVGREDSGNYYCNANNLHGYSEANTWIEVETRPSATCVPDQVTLQPGNSLQIQCLAHGSHPIQFTWSRMGRVNLPAGAETTKDGKLLMSSVKVNDSGTYRCVATNHIGSSITMANVTVKA